MPRIKDDTYSKDDDSFVLLVCAMCSYKEFGKVYMRMLIIVPK